MAAEFIPLLPSRRTKQQDTPTYDAETFANNETTPAPMALALLAVLFLYALIQVSLVATSRNSVPAWLYRSILSLGLAVMLGVVVLFLLRYL